jgi:uncharacterized protein (DUF58 family)
LLLGAAGIWLVRPLLLIGAMIPIVFIIYSNVTQTVAVDDSFDISRTVTPPQTYPGGTVSAELTVTNRTEQSFQNLRLIDGVPDELAVIDGSPRGAVSLQQNESVSFEYTLRARYGTYEFTAVQIAAHGLNGNQIARHEQFATGDTQIEATLEPDEFPLPGQTTGLTGELTADRGGEGLEFHAIRAYQPEDPINRINWKQYARDRELSTIDYRQQEAAEILVAVDARPSAAVARDATAPTGTELCVYAAIEVIDGLLATRNRVGLTVFGLEDDTEANDPTVSPGTDREVRIQIQQLLDTAAATVQPGANRDGDPTQFELQPTELIERLNPQTQLIILTPLVDGYPVKLAQQTNRTGRAVSVYSPAIAGGDSLGGTMAAVQRELRLL